MMNSRDEKLGKLLDREMQQELVVYLEEVSRQALRELIAQSEPEEDYDWEYEEDGTAEDALCDFIHTVHIPPW